jgi:hypothetical protein
MVAIVLFIASVILVDALLMVADPSLYRRCMEYVEQEIGSAWIVANALVFMVPGLAFLVRSVSSKMPVWSALLACMSVLIGVFFALASTERFAYLGGWWRSRSNAQYRIAGVVGIGLSASMLALALQLARN